MVVSELKQQVRDLISRAKTKEALAAILMFAQNSKNEDLENQVVSIQGMLEALQIDERRLTILDAEASVRRAKITKSILSLMDDIEQHTIQPKKTILLITASPSGLAMPNVGRQQRAITETINEKRQENMYELKMIGFVLPEDLIDEIERQNPDIIHFFMHNDTESGLYFENGNGEEIPIEPEDLALIFKEISRRKKIECTVLNACNSAMHVSAICAYVPNIVFTNDFVPDSVGAGNNDTIASLFTRKFYEQVFLNRTYQEAVERANIALKFSRMSLSNQNKKKIEEIFSIKVNHIS